MQDAPMSRARFMQENRKMRFEEAGWTQGRLTQAEAALLLGQCERSFRRHIERYEADGLEGLLDRRLRRVSKRRAGGAEVDRVVALYKSSFAGWSVAHSKYKCEFAGARSYSWLKSVLQGAGVIKASKRRGKIGEFLGQSFFFFHLPHLCADGGGIFDDPHWGLLDYR